MTVLKNITINDFDFKRINAQIVETGATISRAEPGRTYFICAVFGSSITIKDSLGTTIISGIGTQVFYNPIRIDDGFTITGTTLSVNYFVV